MNKEEQVIKVLNDDEIRDFILKKDYKIFKLQQRIDKAIEYIENSDKYDFSKCELLFILKGEEDE